MRDRIELRTLATQRIDALIVGTDSFFNSRREQIVALAARRGLARAIPYATRSMFIGAHAAAPGRSVESSPNSTHGLVHLIQVRSASQAEW